MTLLYFINYDKFEKSSNIGLEIEQIPKNLINAPEEEQNTMTKVLNYLNNPILPTPFFFFGFILFFIEINKKN